MLQFAFCLLIIFIVELAVGIAAAVFKSDFEMVMRDTLKSSMDNYYDIKSDRLAWDKVQTKVIEKFFFARLILLKVRFNWDNKYGVSKISRLTTIYDLENKDTKSVLQNFN